MTSARPDGAQKRILLVKTALDGHWRGLSMVARALRDAGFHVIIGGMITGPEMVRAAVDEDVDLVGLNVGGHSLVVERVIGELRAARPQLPIFAGGVLPPSVCRRLAELGVETYPPGSTLEAIVAAAVRLTGAAAAAG